jgi:uncharacterized protein
MSGDFSDRLRGFGPIGIAAIAVILLAGNIAIAPLVHFPAGALLVLVWARMSDTPWREIGYVRPKSWLLTIATGLAFGIAFKLAMKALVMPLLGAEPVNRAYHFLTGNTAMLPAATWAMINAGFAEETVFRGFLFERLGKLLGASRWAKVAIVIVTSVGFGLIHYPVQGLAGAQQATIVGLVAGSIYATAGWLPMLMIAHAAFDLTALAIIYFDLEADVAHLIFR